MAFLQVPNVSIKGLSACVPKTILENSDLSIFTPEESEKFIAATGVKRRRIADSDVCTSDLCYHAAERLISDLGWSKDEIDCLIFVTQTPDYILPATSGLLQNRLNLKTEILALDISLGCSGWIYGLNVISNLLAGGQLKKGLLLVGDTISKICSAEDKSTYPLFGDAGTATALEYDQQSQGIKFHLATDGSGAETIIIPDGGFRNQFTPKSLIKQSFEGGINRSDSDLALDGMNVFSFGISKAPDSVNKLQEQYEINPESVDFYLFHQANLFMNEKIRKKLKIPIEKVPYSLADFGNTSSASIPLTICQQLRGELKAGEHSIVACGFGVGLSWGSAWFVTNDLICSEIVEI